MNDQLPTDQRQLEQATSRFGSCNGIHDANVLASRQAWLSVGAAAEAAGREGLDEQALLASLQGELLKSPAVKADNDSQQVDWSWAAVIVAACVLLAATVVGTSIQRPAAVPGAGSNEQLVKPLPSPTPASPPRETIVSDSPSSSSWTDLDEAIYTTHTSLHQLSQQRNNVDQSLTDFDAQLKQLSADLAAESL